MLAASVPPKIPLIWASSATTPYVNPIPTPSQQGVKNGAASFTDGFPPLCFVPIATGGAGPFGADFNGALQQITAGLQWSQAGAPYKYDPTFSTSISGYANGALIPSGTTAGLWWLSTADSNASDPDTGGANWTPVWLAGAHSFGVSGYQKLTSGMIIQWGLGEVVIASGWGQVTVTFPIAFPNECFEIVASDNGIFGDVYSSAGTYACSSVTPTNFVMTAATPNDGSASGTVGGRYIALGY